MIQNTNQIKMTPACKNLSSIVPGLSSSPSLKGHAKRDKRNFPRSLQHHIDFTRLDHR